MSVASKSVAGLAAACLAGAMPASAADTTVPAFAAEGPQCRGADGYAQDFGGRRTFLWRPAWLEASKARAGSDPAYRTAIVKAGDAALERGPYSVTDKTKPVPGAGPHDYASIGPYWWPDPDKRDGLPYVRRDGEVNPERDGPEFDKDRLRNLAADVKALALAYYVTGEDRFADHAAGLVRTWFIDPATRMAPNFDFAQGIPGKVKGRGEGLIEASDLSTVIEAVGLLGPSGALSDAEGQALRDWYGQFVVWMATSANGEDEMRKTNNHGLFYDFRLAHFALFAGAPSAARNVVEAAPDYRIARQMDRQGRFLAELKRTKSWHYSVFAVDALARLATIGECVDRDLWSARLEDGRDLATAHAFLAKYADDPSRWPFPDLDKDRGRFERMRDEYTGVDRLFVGRDDAEATPGLP